MIEFDYEKIMQPNVVVNCDTYEKALIFLEWADSIGLKWDNSKSYIYNFWDLFGQKTCYNLYNGVYSSYTYFRDNNYTIYKYEDVIIKK